MEKRGGRKTSRMTNPSQKGRETPDVGLAPGAAWSPPPRTWAKGHCLQMLCLPGFGTHANTQNLPHFCAFPASIQEHSPPKCLFSLQTLNCQIAPVLPSYSTPPPLPPLFALGPRTPPPHQLGPPPPEPCKKSQGGWGEEGKRGRGGKGVGLREGKGFVRKAPDTFNFLRHVMRAILSVRPEGNPFKTCATPQAHSEKLNRANRYENELV